MPLRLMRNEAGEQWWEPYDYELDRSADHLGIQSDSHSPVYWPDGSIGADRYAPAERGFSRRPERDSDVQGAVRTWYILAAETLERWSKRLDMMDNSAGAIGGWQWDGRLFGPDPGTPGGRRARLHELCLTWHKQMLERVCEMDRVPDRAVQYFDAAATRLARHIPAGTAQPSGLSSEVMLP